MIIIISASLAASTILAEQAHRAMPIEQGLVQPEQEIVQILPYRPLLSLRQILPAAELSSSLPVPVVRIKRNQGRVAEQKIALQILQGPPLGRSGYV